MDDKQAIAKARGRFIAKKNLNGLWEVIDRTKCPELGKQIQTLGVFLYRGDAFDFRDAKRDQAAKHYTSAAYEFLGARLKEMRAARSKPPASPPSD